MAFNISNAFHINNGPIILLQSLKGNLFIKLIRLLRDSQCI